MTNPLPTRERILEGARAAVVERGLRATTVQDILDAAGISRRTFYQHFRSQEDVLHALFDEGAERLVAAMATALAATDDPGEQVDGAVDAYLDFQLEGGTLVIVLQAESIAPGSLLAPLRERTMDRIVDLVGDAVERATGARVDPLVWRTLIIGIEGLVIHAQRGGTFTAEDRDALREVALPVFRAVLVSLPYLPRVD